jgi:hypothetical protein
MTDLAPMDQPLYVHAAYVVQLGLGLVFLLSALPKLRHPGAFHDAIAEYRIVPTPLVVGATVVLIASETFLAIALLGGWLVQVAFPLAVVTLVVFLAAVAVNLRRGRRIACGCFGNLDQTISRQTVVRLSALAVAAAISAAVYLGANVDVVGFSTVISSGTDVARYMIEMTAVSVFGLLAGLWLLSLPELLAVVRRAGSTGSHDAQEEV